MSRSTETTFPAKLESRADSTGQEVQVDGGPFSRQRSDREGRLRAERVVPGSYILRIRPAGARARALDLEVPPLRGDESGSEIALTLPSTAADEPR